MPEKWKARAKAITNGIDADIDAMPFSDWLHDCYFDGVRDPQFAEEHIEVLGDLLTKMMRYKPEDRLSTKEILQHGWFASNPLRTKGGT